MLAWCLYEPIACVVDQAVELVRQQDSNAPSLATPLIPTLLPSWKMVRVDFPLLSLLEARELY